MLHVEKFLRGVFDARHRDGNKDYVSLCLAMLEMATLTILRLPS